MSTRTGVAITEYLEFGGISGSATLMDAALNIGWNRVEDELDTNIIVSLESDEVHLWPKTLRDWDERYDRVVTAKNKVTSVSSVLVDSDIFAGCTCQLTTFSGCAIVTDYDAGIIVVRECVACATQACSCTNGTVRPFIARLNYYAGLFPSPPLPDDLVLAVVSRAKEAWGQITEGNAQNIGKFNTTSWHSMDYSESRAGPRGNKSFIDELVSDLLKPYKVKRAFSLRRTY